MDKVNQPAVIVIFGASGDLARRKIIPAFYNLFLDGWLADGFAIAGVARSPMSDDAFREHLRRGMEEFSRRTGHTEQWHAFASHLTYLSGDYQDDTMWAALSRHVAENDELWHTGGRRIFYLSTPPSAFVPIVERLRLTGICRDCERTRIVLEKPFGRDLASARALDSILASQVEESQIYRIDHYLGKETVQNILAFRFANAIFEPLWNRRDIDHIQITVAEDVGVEHRGGYYEQAGALRDMIQNHMLQMLCLAAMEPPVSFQADEIRNKMVDVLRAMPPLSPQDVAQNAVRGQYGEGTIKNTAVPAYRAEPETASDSSTETYAAVKLLVDNWRWQGVPFYLRTGKRLPQKLTQVVVQFRPLPHQSFPAAAVSDWQPNRITMRIQPQERIFLRFHVKQPGPSMQLTPVNMDFCYADHFGAALPEAYETLLLDIMRGDATLFMRADQVEAAWSVVAPILDAWATPPPDGVPTYAAGTWGPAQADELLARDGRRWLTGGE